MHGSFEPTAADLSGQPSLASHVGQATSRTAEIVRYAMNALGTPYRYGGNSLATGFDCSGFVQAIVRQSVGLLLPRNAIAQARATEIIRQNQLRPGDLVFFNTVRRRAFSHVGIYIGEGQFIHAPRSGARVRVEDMSTRYWQRRFNGARRLSLNMGGPDTYSTDDRAATSCATPMPALSWTAFQTEIGAPVPSPKTPDAFTLPPAPRAGGQCPS